MHSAYVSIQRSVRMEILALSARELHVEFEDTEALAESLNDICIAWGNSASMHLLPTSMALKGMTFQVNLPLAN